MFGGNRNQALFSQVAQALDSQLEVIGGLRNLVEAQEKRLAGSDALAAMHTDQIVALTTVIANIAMALTSSGALPRDAASAVRDATMGALEPPISEGVRLVLKYLDIWVESAARG
jgi:hypothetical protein